MARPVTVGLNLTANTLTTVYTVPTGYYAKWNLMYMFNSSGSTKNCTCYYNDVSAGADIYIMNDLAIISKNYEKIDGGSYMVLEEGDTVKTITEAGSAFTIICTFELFKKEGI